jgi:adenosylcobinamide-GDP ribazoletransferase
MMSVETQIPAERPRLISSFLAAVQFLLVSPAFIKRDFTPQELGAAVGFFPLAGLILGAILVGADHLLGLVFPALVRAALLLGIWVSLTGALHLDGFLDACDGLLGGFDPEQRLSIMRDERVGAYALVGGVLLLLVKFSAIASLPVRLPALLLAPVLGRWAIAWAVTACPYARPIGLGRSMKDNAGKAQAVQASVSALLIVGAVMLAYRAQAIYILAAVAVVGIATWLSMKFALKRIPGLTGDIYGAINELVELAVLVVLTTW